MKKLMTLMLGLSLLGGTMAAFAQEPKKEDSKDKKGYKKGKKKKKKEETPKK